MSGSNTPPSPETPHLVSLVLHSKKALQHGEQLCTRAHELTRGTSRIAAALLALDAKAKWVEQGISDQLKLAGSVAKSIELQRSRLDEQAKEWDKARTLHAGNLDAILESLERRLVPPDFHQSASASSIFGSQHSDEEDESSSAAEGPARLNVRDGKDDKEDRSKWKTLRDFIHERGIEEATETMDNDRIALDDIFTTTEDFPRILSESVEILRQSVPPPKTLPSMQDIFEEQERVTANMATHLENLASHYEEMSDALRDKEAGEELTEDDLQDMNRDTDELPRIIAELEDDVEAIRTSHDQLQATKNDVSERLKSLRNILERLDDLEEVMASMLEQQQNTERDFEGHLASLQQHLTTLEHLCLTYTSYEMSYNNLLFELDRRRRYRDATEELVRGMAQELEQMRNEEIQRRETFYALHGDHLPEDLCLCIANVPTKWDVGPAVEETLEELPDVDDDLLAQAIKRIDMANLKSGEESL